MDRYECLLRMLVEKGNRDAARSCVSRQAHIVGCELREKQMPEPDKPTLELELIDDLRLKMDLDNTLLNPDSTREECLNALDLAIRELKENYVQKCREKGWEP